MQPEHAAPAVDGELIALDRLVAADGLLHHAATRRPLDRGQRHALGALVDALRRADPALTDGRLARWYTQQHTAADGARLTARDPIDRRRLAGLARALLTVDGTLTGPAVLDADRGFRAGDHVITRGHDHTVDRDGEPFPPPGVPGRVSAVDTDTCTITVDFPTWGTHRVACPSPAAAALDHDYVEPGHTRSASRHLGASVA
jgi:hypothetical protein